MTTINLDKEKIIKEIIRRLEKIDYILCVDKETCVDDKDIVLPKQTSLERWYK